MHNALMHITICIDLIHYSRICKASCYLALALDGAVCAFLMMTPATLKISRIISSVDIIFS